MSFEGVVKDIRPYLSQWRFALLNPRGFGEADSQTLKELLSNGVPTFASRNFGLSDFTSSNPRASLGRLLPSRDAHSIVSATKNMESFENVCNPMNDYLEFHQGWNEKVLMAWTAMLEDEDVQGSSLGVFEPQPLRNLWKRLGMHLSSVIMRTQFLLEQFLNKGKIS